MIYNYDDVYSKTLEYFNGDTLATDVFIKKYCLKDSAGNLYEQSPDDMHHRLAKEFARIENKYPNPLSEDEIYEYEEIWDAERIYESLWTSLWGVLGTQRGPPRGSRGTFSSSRQN